MIISAGTRFTRFFYVFSMPTFFLAKKYRSGWSKENRENRVIVYPPIFLKWVCIRFSLLFVIKFLSYYYL